MLKKNTTVIWVKDGVVLDRLTLEGSGNDLITPLDNCDYCGEELNEGSGDLPTSNINKFNQPYIVKNASPDDIGQYSCSIDTGIQNILMQRHILFPSIKNLSTETNHTFTNKELNLACSVIIIIFCCINCHDCLIYILGTYLNN